MIRKNRLIGANATASTEMTVIATITSASACRTCSRAPNTRLNRYSVGRQIASVTRNSSGSFTADTTACSAALSLLKAPSTAPKQASAIVELTSMSPDQPAEIAFLADLLPDAVPVAQDALDDQAARSPVPCRSPRVACAPMNA